MIEKSPKKSTNETTFGKNLKTNKFDVLLGGSIGTGLRNTVLKELCPALW
jgi:hypothetical protein